MAFFQYKLINGRVQFSCLALGQVLEFEKMGLFTGFPFYQLLHTIVYLEILYVRLFHALWQTEKRMQGISDFVKMVAWKNKNFASVPTSSQGVSTCKPAERFCGYST